MKPDKSRQRGSILIVAIMVIMVMLIITIPFLVKLSGQSRSAERAYRALSAFNLAEAGAERALWELNLNFSNPEIVDPEDEIIDVDADGNMIFGPVEEFVGEWTGQFQGTIVEDLSAEPNTRTIVSTGRMPFIGDGTVDRTVRVVLEKYYRSIWDFGFFFDYRVDGMNNQFLLDSYDSREGQWDPSVHGDLGFLGLNSYYEDGSFTAKNSEVYGAIVAGGDLLTMDPPQTADPEIIDNVIDTKNTEVTKLIMDAPFEMPPVDVLDLYPKSWSDPYSIENWFNESFTDGTVTPNSVDIVAGFNKGQRTVDGDVTFTSADNGVYTNLSITNSSTLRISGDVTLYVTGLADGADGDFTLGPVSGANIVLEDGASLTLILGKTSFFAGQLSSINMIGDEPGVPANCIILGTDSFMPTPYDQNIKNNVKDPENEIPTGVFYVEQHLDMAAAVYMPRAEVREGQGDNHLEVWGAWIAYSIYLKTQTEFHYDEALGDLMKVKGGFPYWRVVSWQEVIGQ